MKVSEVTIIYKRTIQMRQFEPAEISVAIKAQVDPGDIPETIIGIVRKMARSEVEKERERLLDERMEQHEKEKSA